MTEFLHDILEDRQNVLTDIGSADHQLRFYLDKVRDTPLEELDSQEKKKLVFLLLRQLQPYLSAQNLSTAPNQPENVTLPQAPEPLVQKRETGNFYNEPINEEAMLGEILGNINV